MINDVTIKTTPRSEFWAGARDVAPFCLGVIPFGLVSGAIAVQAGFSVVEATALSLIVFAGSAQLVALQLLMSGAILFIILLSAAFVNLRMLMYSVSIAPYFQHLPLRWKLLLAYGLVDQAYALSIVRYQEDGRDLTFTHYYFIATAFIPGVLRHSAAVIGALVGAHSPASWSLGFVVPVAFTALVVPRITSRPALAAALVSGVTAVLAADLPFNIGLPLAAVLGIGTAVFLETSQSS